jgi:enterochelin esterase-like enzyme
MRIGIAALVAAIFLCGSLSAVGQEPKNLTAGFREERTLGRGENHVYTVDLESGAAILGEADQHGVDLVIDMFGPDGKLIRTVDSPNGTEGPEPIDLTAFTTGQYKLVIHTLDPGAKPGKYIMKIDRLVTADENGPRMAEKNYPPALQGLWEEYVKDPNAVDQFIASRKGKGPIIEEIKGDSRNVNVTYLYYGDEHTEKVEVFGDPHEDSGGRPTMQRFMRTPLFFVTDAVPKDARYRYAFVVTETHFAGPKEAIQLSEEKDTFDPLNPDKFEGLSVMVLPAAPPQLYVDASDSVPHGKVTPTNLKSAPLKEERTLSIYTPPGYDGATAADLLIVFDGATYVGNASSGIPTPTILDNLIAAKKIGPTVAIFVNNMGQRTRDLGGYAPFADFVALELIPWARKNYRIHDGPSHVVLAGSSRGGLAASHCAFMHSDVVGKVLSQSGAYWVRNDEVNPLPWPITEDTGDLTLSFRKSAPLPIKFYMEVGRFDSLLKDNRELRDVLMVKGYQLSYREFDGGHDYFSWRGSLEDGLISLLGQR